MSRCLPSVAAPSLPQGTVRKHGHSTAGEQWDATQHEDCWYEGMPHNGGFWGAIKHSPQLLGVAELPRDVLSPIDEGGMDDLL